MRRPWRAVLRLEDLPVLAGVALLPWAFGGVEMWAYRAAAFLVAGGPAIALLRGRPLLQAPRPTWCLPAALLCAWALAQSLPMPRTWIDAVSPAAGRVAADALPAAAFTPSREGAEALERWAASRLPAGIPPPPRSADATLVPRGGPVAAASATVSMAPAVTRESFYWYATLWVGACFVASRTMNRDVRRLYAVVLLTAFAAVASFALVQAAFWNGRLFWIWQVAGRPFGPYIAGTHCGGLMELAAPWMAGTTWAVVRRHGLRALVRPRGAVPAAGTAVCLLAGLLAQSKMAAFLIAASLTVLALLVAHDRRSRRLVLVGASAVWIAAASVIAGSQFGGRIRDFVEASGGSLVGHERTEAWRACVPAIRDFPITGAGFGTFRYVFPRYLPAGETGAWNQAHNDYLEFLLGGGAVGVVLLVWMAAAAARGTAARLGASAHRGDRAAQWGLMLGVAALAIHALVDFNHQIPANGLAFFVLAAMAAAPVGAEDARP